MSNEPPGHAVVTGSSGGIGRTIAEALLAAGWRVSGLDAAAPSIAHAAFTPLQVDVRDAAALASAATAVRDAYAMVHCAGVMRVGALGALDLANGVLMWQLHVQAAIQLADVLVPAMAARGRGRVVLLGSRVAQGMPGRSQYAATKAALGGLARSWGAEVVGQGVTVNVVSPAATDTGMLQDPLRAASAPRLPPMGRLIAPAEIASLVLYLLSPQADAITGQDIAICGGASLPR